MSKALEDVSKVMDAMYQSRVSGLQSLIAQEVKLRDALRCLEDMRQISTGSALDDHAMRALGADLLWQGWLTRQRSEINTQLANLLVQKAALMDALRLAFGRSQVAATLVTNARIEAKAKRNKLNNRD
ncbi:MAG: hypothetical protein LPJ92_05100 [Rhodobacterales bacterium]|nr:hypothetical protein [Rhodobacterales bacterium]MDX5389691.1 hypothetical protein [Rhodobacterales bacterium]MDX5489388.1 hypothetical protein [Rhodobacterales bacterium]